MKPALRYGLYGAIGLVLAFVIAELPHTNGQVTMSPMIAKVDVPTMVKDADLIVRGRVEKKLGTVRRSYGTDDMVYTRWLIAPDEILKGQAAKIVVWTMGGQYLSTIVDVEDQPTLTVGQSYVMLLRALATEKNAFQIDESFQGLLTVTDQNEYVQYNTNETVRRTELTLTP